MISTNHKRKFLGLTSAVSAAMFGLFQPAVVFATTAANDNNTKTPIKHVIVIVGENRTFDHLFATYVPKTGTISNMLSKGIINADGTPGPNYSLATQYSASDTTTFSNSPTTNKTAYTSTNTSTSNPLPLPQTGGPSTASNTNPPPFATLQGITNLSNAYNANNLPYVPSSDLGLLLTGATGIASGTDTRILNVNNLPPGPFQLSPGVTDDDYAASPVHRFYQMWQQTDCNTSYATAGNPSGCKSDLFAWVERTVSTGGNGNPIGSFSGEGSTALGFYNVQNGDIAYFKSLADNYTIADNYHQPIMGGTGANSIMLGTADPLWYSDGNGNATVPPSTWIENPDPQSGTNNYYTQDGYSGGSFINCSGETVSGNATTTPGIAAITSYLSSINISPNCAAGHYYLVNNYDPGYYGDGSVDSSSNGTWGVANNGFVIPPSSVPTIADKLYANGISWSYYGEGWNAYKANPNAPTDVYCNICNPFLYSTAVMTNATQRANLKDTSDFDTDIANKTLPAVSYIKPGGLLDGHPASSKVTLFEALVQRVITTVQGNSNYAGNTAILITVDEGGGYYDSGYIQPLDFFGDGTRIPLIVVSPYSTGGRVVHTYYDHDSVVKFIEANWGLSTLSSRSRDNYPNPVVGAGRGASPYVPVNTPAIGNLMNMFQFPTGTNPPAD
jgi:phospholipase C